MTSTHNAIRTSVVEGRKYWLINTARRASRRLWYSTYRTRTERKAAIQLFKDIQLIVKLSAQVFLNADQMLSESGIDLAYDILAEVEQEHHCYQLKSKSLALSR